MTLAHRTDFALRTLMYLGGRDSTRATSAEIAGIAGISTNHLIKIVNDLSRRGYVRTIRGPGGGVELARDAEDIQLGDMIEELQGPVRLHDCTASSGICVLETFCRLRGILRQADELQFRFLNRYTLADIVPDWSNSGSEAFDPAI